MKERNYFEEAIKILKGTTMLLAQKEHLEALNNRLEEEGVYLICQHEGEHKNGICLECGEDI